MDIKKVGKAISYLRKRAGYTQKELADRIGISDKAVSKWERGQGLPEIGYLRKLSILLDTDTDSLLAGDVAHHKSDWIGIIVFDINSHGIGAGTIIYDKPLINYLLSYFLLVGIKDIYIACTMQDESFIKDTLGEGDDFGIHISTVVGGLKDVALFIEQYHPEVFNKDRLENVMLVYGRCILYGVDQTRFFQKAMVDREHLIILALPKKMQKAKVEVDIDKRVICSETEGSKRIRTQYDFSELPIMFFPISILSDIIMEDNITSFNEKQKDCGNLYVETLDRGFVEIEVDDWNNVMEASTFIRIVQEKCGMNVYCLEEVAWRRGLIDLERMKELGERNAGTEYGEYVLGLYERLNIRVNGGKEVNGA